MAAKYIGLNWSCKYRTNMVLYRPTSLDSKKFFVLRGAWPQIPRQAVRSSQLAAEGSGAPGVGGWGRAAASRPLSSHANGRSS